MSASGVTIRCDHRPVLVSLRLEGPALFRRTKSPATPAEDQQLKSGGKGRPTPSRKEAEAAARERARAPRNRRELAKRQREQRGESSKKMREAMRSGDERYLPIRDKGPTRRFIRDLVDSRFGFTELLFPLLIVIMVMMYGAFGDGGARLGQTLWFTTILLVLMDVIFLRFRIRKQVRERFGDDEVKGAAVYGIMRALNMRFLRLPKPQVKIGQKLPDQYR